MKNFFKTIIIFLILLSLFVFSGCFDNTQNKEQNNKLSSNSEENTTVATTLELDYDGDVQTVWSSVDSHFTILIDKEQSQFEDIGIYAGYYLHKENQTDKIIDTIIRIKNVKNRNSKYEGYISMWNKKDKGEEGIIFSGYYVKNEYNKVVITINSVNNDKNKTCYKKGESIDVYRLPNEEHLSKEPPFPKMYKSILSDSSNVYDTKFAVKWESDDRSISFTNDNKKGIYGGRGLYNGYFVNEDKKVSIEVLIDSYFSLEKQHNYIAVGYGKKAFNSLCGSYEIINDKEIVFTIENIDEKTYENKYKKGDKITFYAVA